MASWSGVGTYLTAERTGQLVKDIRTAYHNREPFALTRREFAMLVGAGFSIPSEFVENQSELCRVVLRFDRQKKWIDLPTMTVDSDPYGGPSVSSKPAIPEGEDKSLYQQMPPPAVKSSPSQEQLVPWQNLPGAVSTFLMDYWIVSASKYGLTSHKEWEGNTFAVQVGTRGLSIKVTVGMFVADCGYEQSTKIYVGDYPKSGKPWWWMGDKLDALIDGLVEEYREEAKG